MKFAKIFVLLFLASAALTSCKNDSSMRDSARSEIEDGAQKIAEKTTAAVNDVTNKPVVPEERNDPKTEINFEKTKYDFGKVPEGEKVSFTYQFTNVGTKPLIIYDAKPSCGCTVPEKPDGPIAPGETAEIKAQFDSAGKPGKQSKTITVTSNTEPGTIVLNFNGEVLPKK